MMISLSQSQVCSVPAKLFPTARVDSPKLGLIGVYSPENRGRVPSRVNSSTHLKSNQPPPLSFLSPIPNLFSLSIPVLPSTMPPLPHALLFPTLPSPLPTPCLPKNAPFSSSHRYSTLRFPSSRRLLRCSLVSVSTEAPPAKGESRGTRLSPAEVSRTIMDLSSTGTLSTLTPDGWPLGIGARFVVDAQGAPALCLNQPDSLFVIGGRSSFHVQLEQNRSRTTQCTLFGRLSKPDDELLLKKLCTKWEKKFGEEVDEDLVYLISIERVLHMEDFKENGVWVTSSEYINADPDPIRNFAEKIVEEMNFRHAEDVQRLCNIYVDSGFQVTDTKMIWVDRLGFDVYIYSEKGVFAARIPFPGEVADKRGVKSSFNSMSHLAWEVEKNYVVPDFEKVTCLRKIR